MLQLVQQVLLQVVLFLLLLLLLQSITVDSPSYTGINVTGLTGTLNAIVTGLSVSMVSLPIGTTITLTTIV